jgi:shikimate kinase
VVDSRNIVLIGFMGAGKTVVGKSLAGFLNKPYFDTDILVEEEAGATIDTIFETLGEDAFRELETTTIKRLAEIKGAVISTGGGAIKNPENVSLLKGGNFVVYLHATPDVLFQRIREGAGGRPLAAPMRDSSDIAIMLADREPQYRAAADLVVDTSNKTMQEVENEIFRAIGY